MPDSDRVHAALPYRYQKTYKQLCEGYGSGEELARNVLKPLKKDIQDYGDGPIKLIKQMGERLEQIASAPPILKSSTNWDAESKNIERLAQKTYGDPRGVALAVQSCEEVLQAVQLGEVNQNCAHQIAHRYVQNIYDANFVERIPMKKDHYNGVDQATLDRRLAKIVNRLTQNETDTRIFESNLLRLYQCYVEEWDKVADLVASGLTSKVVLSPAV